MVLMVLDQFFCAVEEQRDPALKGRPFAVGGRPEGRGVVASASYAARAFGVRSAMPMAHAVRLCPELTVVRPNFPAYRAASQQVMERLHALTPLVEQISIDEAFLDVSDLGEPGDTIAARLQATIRTELALSCSLGVATNKLVAKIATDVGKGMARSGAIPSAICVVPPGEEAAFFAPLPASALWGVGPKTAEKLAAMGIRTIGDLAAWPPDDLARRFGQHGEDLARRARGVDDRPIVTERAAKSISQETTLAHDVRDRVHLEQTLRGQAAEVAAKLQRKGVLGTAVKLKIRWPDFTTPTRQLTLPRPTDEVDVIVEAALRLFQQVWPEGQPVRLIGVGVSGLGAPPRQLSLWDTPTPEEQARQAKVQAALAAIRARFGQDLMKGDGMPRRLSLALIVALLLGACAGPSAQVATPSAPPPSAAPATPAGAPATTTPQPRGCPPTPRPPPAPPERARPTRAPTARSPRRAAPPSRAAT
ncbi:MAG: DNA polymerase IV [Chloroflexales bacterium]|nr:DNA polymerase IV [Chloroflexales bacterium]